MKFLDPIYGRFEIKTPVMLEVIKTYALERLKGVDQAGYSKAFYPSGRYSRFEHSLGVWWLLNRFGAPIEEQIAGLIHDISHTAFSHAADYIFAGGSAGEQNHQDNHHEEYVMKTEIPKILKRYGFDTGYILDERNFPLKETKLPDICADRIDYSLRTAFHYKVITSKKVSEFIKSFKIIENKWVFENLDKAREYALLFNKLNTEYYSSFTSAVMFRTTGDYIGYALRKKYINLSDLYTTDKEVLSKIKQYHAKDNSLVKFWKRMNIESKAVQTVKGNEDAVAVCKSRIVDPLISENGKLFRFSDKLPVWKKLVYDELKPKKYFIKFL